MKNLQKNDRSIEIITSKIHTAILNSETAIKSIDVVYIFGSVLNKKKFKQNSDIDIAFLLNKTLYKQNPLKTSTNPYLIATKIGLSLERQTDVIMLNSASIETTFQIITTGIVIYDNYSEKRVEYEIAIKGLYYDFKPFLNTIRLKSIEGLNQL